MQRDVLALALRLLTTDPDIRAGLRWLPHVLEDLRDRPGPYSEYVAEQDAADAAREIDQMIRYGATK